MQSWAVAGNLLDCIHAEIGFAALVTRIRNDGAALLAGHVSGSALVALADVPQAAKN